MPHTDPISPHRLKLSPASSWPQWKRPPLSESRLPSPGRLGFRRSAGPAASEAGDGHGTSGPCVCAGAEEATLPGAGCKNLAAPVFGMVCKEHKNVSKAKIKKYREERRQAAPSTGAKPAAVKG